MRNKKTQLSLKISIPLEFSLSSFMLGIPFVNTAAAVVVTVSFATAKKDLSGSCNYQCNCCFKV